MGQSHSHPQLELVSEHTSLEDRGFAVPGSFEKSSSIRHTVPKRPRTTPITEAFGLLAGSGHLRPPNSTCGAIAPYPELLDDPNDPELALLPTYGSGSSNRRQGHPVGTAAVDHTLRTAPIVTGDAVNMLEAGIIPQRAVYGRMMSQRSPGFNPFAETSAKFYINTNAPFSAVVCGVQGSGKSHTTSVLLESCLIRDVRLGTLPAPLSGLVFHFDTISGVGDAQPCEAAYLASLNPLHGGVANPPEVVVLVMPGDLQKMKTLYGELPNVRVEPLHFAPEDISGPRLLAMMKVDEGGHLPLYMESILSLMRNMGADGFDYTTFREQLTKQGFNPDQKAMLNLRLSLLDSCLKGGNINNRASNHFKPGRLVIVDLSSPFMEANSACGFFDLILGQFVEHDKGQAKLVVLDEAHKYLSNDGRPSRLTESLLSVIRQQRHLNTRVVISTQEPTVVPASFLDLCSIIIAHRFSSPRWLRHLAEHVSSIGLSQDTLFSEIVSLQTGEAVVFAPAGLSVSVDGTLSPLGQGYWLVHSRERITLDGGRSLLAVHDDQTSDLQPSYSAFSTRETSSQDNMMFEKGQRPSSRRTSSASDTTRIGFDVLPSVAAKAQDDEATGTEVTDPPIVLVQVSTPVASDAPLPRGLLLDTTTNGVSSQEPANSSFLSSSVLPLPTSTQALDPFPTRDTKDTYDAHVLHRCSPLLTMSNSGSLTTATAMNLSQAEGVVVNIAANPPNRIANLPSPSSSPSTISSGTSTATTKPVTVLATNATSITASTSASLVGASTAMQSNSAPSVMALSSQHGSALSAEMIALLQVLEEQRASGEKQPLWSAVGSQLKQREPRMSIPLKALITACEARGLVVSCGLQQGGHHRVQLASSESIVKSIDPKFQPLLQLFLKKGNHRLNNGEVGMLKKSHKGLIPEGHGEVTAYIQSAAEAGLVRADGNWVYLILPGVL